MTSTLMRITTLVFSSTGVFLLHFIMRFGLDFRKVQNHVLKVRTEKASIMISPVAVFLPKAETIALRPKS